MYVMAKLKLMFTPKKARNEKGASLVLISIMIPALIGLAAVSIDYAVYSDTKKRLQNGTDAAAMALAKFCAENNTAKCQPSAGNSQATWYVNENMPGATATVSPAASPTAGEITVTGTAEHQNMFARIFGDSTATATATSTATWGGSIVQADLRLPVALGYCDWKRFNPKSGTPQAGQEMEFRWMAPLVATWDWDQRTCSGLPSSPTTTFGQPNERALWMDSAGLAGTFGFTRLGDCKYRVKDVGILSNDFFENMVSAPGSTAYHAECNNQMKSLKIGEVIAVPLYASTFNYFLGLPISVKSVKTVGFAPFQITAFTESVPNFPITTNRVNAAGKCEIATLNIWGWQPVNMLNYSCSGIKGKFVNSSTPIEGAVYGDAVNGEMGAVAVRLTK